MLGRPSSFGVLWAVAELRVGADIMLSSSTRYMGLTSYGDTHAQDAGSIGRELFQQSPCGHEDGSGNIVAVPLCAFEASILISWLGWEFGQVSPFGANGDSMSSMGLDSI